MTTQHTDGRLAVSNDADIIGTENDPESGWVGTVDVAHVYLRIVPGRTEANARREANRRRLVACWNRLEKFTTEQIEDMGYDLFADVRPDFERATRQRDELLAALTHIEGVAMAGEWRDLPEIAEYAHAAIAKAEGKA